MAPYVIFYEALADGVVIVRVLHGARDVGAQFEGE
jgi:plasmid stabilization system protein ParE